MVTKLKLIEMLYLTKCTFLVALIITCISCGGVKEDHLASPKVTPLDSSIIHGSLPNGFTYFIKSLPDAGEKLNLRLYNRAGANQQDADQIDVAHGIEHLAFKATRNFPERLRNSEAVKKLGVDMYDYSASSGSRFTEYYFDIPKDNEKAFDVALLWFKDIANGLKLYKADIEQVKGELRQERLEKVFYKSKKAAIGKLESLIFPCLLDESNFLEHYKNADPEIFRRFYKDWYRPDLMAISIVGDIENPKELEKRIKNTFSDLKRADNFKNPRNCDSLYYQRKPQFHIVEQVADSVSNKPDNKIELKLYYPDPITMENFPNLKGIQRMLLWALFKESLAKRLNEVTDTYNSFYVGAQNSYQYRKLPVSLEIIAKLNAHLKPSIGKIIQVLRQLQAQGLTGEEWEKIKEKQLQYLETEKPGSAEYWVDEIEAYYNYGQVLPENKLAYRKEFLKNLTLDEFNNFLRQFLSKEPRDIGIIAPSKHRVLSLTENEVRSWIHDYYRKPVVQYESPRIPDHLMSPAESSKLKNGIIMGKEIDEIGSHKIILENGATLIFKTLKPNSKADHNQIRIHGFALKGTDCFPKEDFYSAIYAPFIIRNSGMNGLDKFEIERFLKKNMISNSAVSSYIDTQESGIMGASSIENLENILQLIYLHFISPNKYSQAYIDWKENKLHTNNKGSQNDFRIAVKQFTGDSSVVPLHILGIKSLQNGTKIFNGVSDIDLNTSYDIYNHIFNNAQEFTFVISGDFEVDTVLPLFVKYIGNLPGSATVGNECYLEPVKNPLPPGPASFRIPPIGDYEMPNIKYCIKFLRQSANTSNWKEQLKVEALAEVATHLFWDLRFSENYSLYSVGVGGRYNYLMNRYEITSNFNCVPKEYPAIKREVQQIISDIKAGKIGKQDFRLGMDRMHSLYNSKGLAGRHFIKHQNLYKFYRYGQSWVVPEKMENFINSLTVADIIETANKYLKEKYMYEFVMWDKPLE